jgi:hypothetical protein
MAQLSRHFGPLTSPPQGSGWPFCVTQIIVLAVAFMAADFFLTGGAIRKELAGEWSKLHLSALWPERGAWSGKPML